MNNVNLWVLIAIITFVFSITFEIGFRFGRRRNKKDNTVSKTWISTIEVAILSILGLLLAFTFVMVQTRFDLRQQLSIKDANAIGTTYLRTELLPNPQRTAIRKLLYQYANQRIEAIEYSRINLQGIVRRAERLQKKLWTETLSVNINKIHPALFAIYIQSLNHLISVHTERVAAFTNRVPLFVLLTLFVCAILAINVMGYNCGLRNQRNCVPIAMLLVLILVFCMIVDLNHPVQGIIQINRHSILTLPQYLDLL